MQQEHHPALYLSGALATLSGFGLLIFTLYLVPYVLFDLQYDVPEFVIHLLYWYRVKHELAGMGLFLAVFMPFVAVGLLLLFIGRSVTHSLEKQQEHELEEITVTTPRDSLATEIEEDIDQPISETSRYLIEFVVIAAVILLIVLLEFFVF